jgi:autotransporter-associated beta strand protein
MIGCSRYSTILGWLVRGIVRTLALVLVVHSAQACDGFWNLDPVDGDWNNPANWSDNCVPNGALDDSHFSLSNLTEIVISEGTAVFSMDFVAGASSYIFTCLPGLSFSPGKGGIINNSGAVQQFIATTDQAGNVGFITLSFESTAGFSTAFILNGSQVGGGDGAFLQLDDSSDAGGAIVTNNGAVVSGARGGETDFFNSSSAQSATITNGAGEVDGALGGTTEFWFFSRGANSVIANEGGTVSGAAGGLTLFRDNAVADHAVLIANGGTNGGGGGTIQFQGKADGKLARVEVFGNGSLDISLHDTRTVAIGSLEGNGEVLLGAQNLTVGANNLSTTFVGVIEESGSLAKAGTGALTLSGANTYSGTTLINAGTLRVANRNGSATGTGAVNVNAGTLGGKGTITGATTIGTGSGGGAFLEPSVGMRQPATLTMESALTFNADGTYIYKLNTKRAKADQVVANGVTIQSGAQFDFRTIGQKRLSAGTVFTAISNTSVNPINGTFANLPDGSIFTAGRNSYQVSYSGGDGNDLTLTIVP